MSGWAGTLIGSKFESVIDESTGESIMVSMSPNPPGTSVSPTPRAPAQVDKAAKKYKLDANGNIVNPPPADSGGGGSTPASSAFAFGGGSEGKSSASGPGFVFGGGAAASTGGFVFGGGGSGSATTSAAGFVFGGQPVASPPAQEKRKTDVTDRKTAAKKRRVRELRLNGDETGDVLIVGNGDCGQLGLGDSDDDTRDSLVPLVVASLSAQGVTNLACGGMHTIALTVDGKLWTWGNNDDEALGRQGNESLPGLVEGVLSGVQVQMVSAGDSHSAALSRDGRVFNWGVYKDSNGYIGHSPGLKKAAEPMEVAGLQGKRMKFIASGADHTFAVAANEYDVYSWGNGEQGQLGPLVTWEKDGKKKEANQRHLVPTAPFQLRVHQNEPGLRSAAERLGYALNDNFRAFVAEQLGANQAADLTEACQAYLEHRQQLSSAEADDRLRVRAVYCGAYHSFVLTKTENVYACGLNNMGQLGLGSLEPGFTSTPMLVEALEGKGVCQLSGGEHHSLALTEDGEVLAFGRGDSNQLGLGDGEEQHLSPVKVEGLADVPMRKLASGSNQNFGIAKSGDLYSWGFGEMGQLCNGKEGDEATPFLVEPHQMSGLATLDAASGGQHSVLLCMQAER